MADGADIKTEIQKLAPSAMVELFVFDPTPIDENATIYRFHAGTNELKSDVIWQGVTYAAFPVEISGFDLSGNGKSPRPRIRVSNILGFFSSLVLAYGDLVGAKIIRKRTFLKFLDDVNFTGGVNPSGAANPAAEISDDVYFIERKIAETKLTVEFELASILDLEGVFLPRRQVMANLCPFKYRHADGCAYAGAPVAQFDDTAVPTPDWDPMNYPDEFDPLESGYVLGDIVWYVNTRRLFVAKGAVPTGTLPTNNTYWAEDRCGKKIFSCKLRFGATNPLNYGGFPGTVRLPSSP